MRALAAVNIQLFFSLLPLGEGPGMRALGCVNIQLFFSGVRA
jgi:hypothetical protein